MAGKTLIDISLRNELVGFLDHVALRDDDDEISRDLVNRLRPKRIHKMKEKDGWIKNPVERAFGGNLDEAMKKLA